MADVLFVCVHNAGRSQMAKAIFNRLAAAQGFNLRAECAGTEPATHVHENVVAVMREEGIDLAGERPKLLTNEMVEQARRVITMGCAVDSAACPAIFFKNVEDWGLADPAGQPAEAVRAIRETISRKTKGLLKSL